MSDAQDDGGGGFTAVTTPEQVLNAGGVSKRRRNAANRRRSPSGTRTRRPQTPEPPKRDYNDDGEEVTPVKAPRSKSKTRSKSAGGEERRNDDDDVDVISASLTISTVEAVKKHVEIVKPPPAEEVIPSAAFTEPPLEVSKEEPPLEEHLPEEPPKKVKLPSVWLPFLKDICVQWRQFRTLHSDQYLKLRVQTNKCIASLFLVMVYCGIGGLIFRFTEGAFESFYKCGVKRVKRDFIDALWLGSHNTREDAWKSNARRKLMEFEEQLHTAHEAGVTSYSGQRSWSFLNAVVYCLTVVTTIGYGHISPSTTTGRALTIVYAIFGIPMFLILLADFGKLFTRGIKFLWAFVRRLYYTGSCRKVRRTGPVQDVMKGVALVYNFATQRRPSQQVSGTTSADPADCVEAQTHQGNLVPPMEGIASVPGTPVPSNFEVDDEFNLPISVAIVVLLLYIFVGATMYYVWETWGFFESFYFVFISMSTIGFGDFVPQHPMYMMASIIYLVFGLALTSMCINVVQEKLSASFQQASAKIGATIGLRMSEEEASMTPIPPPEIELPEVHQPTVKKAKDS